MKLEEWYFVFGMTLLKQELMNIIQRDEKAISEKLV